MVSPEKGIILTPLQKLPTNGRDWGKLSVSKGFKKFYNNFATFMTYLEPMS